MTLVRHVPRTRDDELLRWLAARRSGASFYALARAAGRAPGPIIAACRNVRDADVAESGETGWTIEAEYP